MQRGARFLPGRLSRAIFKGEVRWSSNRLKQMLLAVFEGRRAGPPRAQKRSHAAWRSLFAFSMFSVAPVGRSDPAGSGLSGPGFRGALPCSVALVLPTTIISTRKNFHTFLNPGCSTR